MSMPFVGSPTMATPSHICKDCWTQMLCPPKPHWSAFAHWGGCFALGVGGCICLALPGLLLFMLPVYFGCLMWLKRPCHCPTCHGKNLVPIDSPLGKTLAASDGEPANGPAAASLN